MMAMGEKGPWAHVDNIYTWFYLRPSTSKGIFLLPKWNGKAILELKFFPSKSWKLYNFLDKFCKSCSMVTKLYTSFNPSIPKLDKRFWATTQVRSSIFYVSNFSKQNQNMIFRHVWSLSFQRNKKRSGWAKTQVKPYLFFLRTSNCTSISYFYWQKTLA